MVIAPRYATDRSLRLLARELRANFSEREDVFIDIFTNRRAAKLREKVWAERGTKQEEALFDRSYVGAYFKNSGTGHEGFTYAAKGIPAAPDAEVHTITYSEAK
jgi:hypothetical protein